MTDQSIQRRLAAIVAADVVGYTRLMEADEVATLANLRELRSGVIEPAVMRHKGRIFKVMGDGFLIEFGSAVDAVAAALEMQRATTTVEASGDRRLLLRIGVNLGDVIDDGSDILGDGVNVAARLETQAAPGGICISAKVHGEIVGKIGDRFFDAGERYLKNLTRPVRVWHWPDALQSTLPLPECPSIAVLPFTNMSGDEADAPFVDGLTEDLITDLSRTAGLFVIARNSVYCYKGKPVDVRLVAQELGVRYVLEGSARRAMGRVRINAQLIDALGGQHLWADRFDRTVEDVFELQDEVNAKIVEALVGRLTIPKQRNRPKNLEAYDLCVRARLLTEESPQTEREAYMLLQRAVKLEPSYAEALGLLAYNRWLAWTHFGEPEDPNRRMAVAFAQKAVDLDPNDAGCRYVLGTILAYERRWEESEAAFAKALELDPNHADTWAAMSDMSVLDGRVADGLAQIEKALRLNPHPTCWYLCHLGQAQYAARDYEAAAATLRREDTYRTNSRKFLAATLAQLGHLEEARREAELFLIAHPHFTIGHWLSSQPLRDASVRDHFVDGFRKAGLPEM
ncbi:adenylate/guanylate cyclase domain-containing protein [Rhizobium ruizarguesonis]|uniref:adenylate/guanylate cyclase domain-containing protein n=1 Tax=Rhizobium ruizarguesonis TaxID=2081791 RepID=UPI0010311255|nr:adenylate/guanylate cyclase domain-containing protein [Rhizobium ruizarguesonis]NEH63557.1 tetratricopeptide repeat protein [Rhizobium ruizarguesonis]NEI21032.1 tetratricopeptide repeat protein [Rhizobium ruizarguesonis]TAY85275.1 adenylate/guanylate cyclase domain-containing protein [Rhizobium ruizarguesonis]TAZ68825.1 adenylate/guanylate cyclase domain-containing protein [Rhizobium ruizarguesonis]TAZ91878.1 adenylate/guanylate cyclase domain-containing protein [Rhizobium ruizarguesonis]